MAVDGMRPSIVTTSIVLIAVAQAQATKTDDWRSLAQLGGPLLPIENV
jgi:hypothetical protein